MDITEVRVFLKEGRDKKLKAYATVTFDDVFVVRNIKVIEGGSGLFIAMPSRKMKAACGQCRFKCDAGSRYCSHCGAQLPQDQKSAAAHDVKAEHRDIAHPVTQQFREYLQSKILEAFKKEEATPSSPAKDTDITAG